MEESIKKMEKYYKQEIADMRKRELELAEIIATKEHENEIVNRELEHNKQELQHKIN